MLGSQSQNGKHSLFSLCLHLHFAVFLRRGIFNFLILNLHALHEFIYYNVCNLFLICTTARFIANVISKLLAMHLDGTTEQTASTH